VNVQKPQGNAAKHLRQAWQGNRFDDDDDDCISESDFNSDKTIKISPHLPHELQK